MKLNRLFSDGAVFQRRAPIAVFGTTEPNSVVSVCIDGNESRGAAGLDGSFLIDLAPMEAGGPYTMTVRNLRTGDVTEVRDILIGEVWLASGQSNMEFRMRESPLQMQAFLAERRGKSDVRMFTVEQRASGAQEHDVRGAWRKSDDPEAVTNFSAVALWYAADLHEKLGVPIGILSSSWGGTIAEAWTSRNTLFRNPARRDILRNLQFMMPRAERWEKVGLEKREASPADINKDNFERICGPIPPNTGLEKGWAEADFDDYSWCNFEIPKSWIAAGINRNGTVWIRKDIMLPEKWAGNDLVLHLGGIDKQDITYFNGEEIGRTGKGYEDKYWDAKREYRIPGRLVKAGRNVIAIRGYSFLCDGSLNGAASDYFVELPLCGERISVAGAARIAVEHDIGIRNPDSHYGVESYGPWYANTPCILFDSMIRPLIPYGIRGVIWYQGESNRRTPGDYERLIKDLITDWRFHWGIGDFPFIQVGLAGCGVPQPFDAESAWSVVRQAQLDSSRDLPNCGMIPAVDIGEAKDIHPKNKREVGSRLAEWSLRNIYHAERGLRECAPVPREVLFEGDRVRVIFDNALSGLVLRRTAASGFFLSGYNRDPELCRAWYPADIVVEGSSVVLTAPDVPQPRHVRYAWADNPDTLSLFNGDGLPAVPFEV